MNAAISLAPCSNCSSIHQTVGRYRPASLVCRNRGMADSLPLCRMSRGSEQSKRKREVVPSFNSTGEFGACRITCQRCWPRKYQSNGEREKSSGKESGPSIEPRQGVGSPELLKIDRQRDSGLSYNSISIPARRPGLVGVLILFSSCSFLFLLSPSGTFSSMGTTAHHDSVR